MNAPSLLEAVREICQRETLCEERLTAALRQIVSDFGARTGTLHRADLAARMLEMVACEGLPEKVRTITAAIPFGKGMAGICAERGEPITVCNLQTDESGVVRPGAKETQVAGALVVPIHRGAILRGTLGVGKPQDHDYTEDEIELLSSCGAIIEEIL